MPTCWAINDGGITSLAAPTLTDNAYIQLSTATAETLVSFAQPQRASSSSGFASLLSMAGSTSFAAGLDMARGSLRVTTLTLGAVQVGVGTGTTRLGRIAQSGGELQVIGTATVLGGSWDLSAGTACAGTLKLQSTAAASGFKQTGARSRRAASISQPGWVQRQLRPDRRHSADQPARSRQHQHQPGHAGRQLCEPGGAGSLLNGTGSFIIGSAGSGALTVQGGARWNSAGGVVGAAADGLVTVTGLGSLGAASGAITVGMPGGTGRIVLSEGGRLQGTSLSLNNAPPLFGGAMGAALEASGYDTSASFTGAVIVGRRGARPPLAARRRSADQPERRRGRQCALPGQCGHQPRRELGRERQPGPGQPGVSSVTVERGPAAGPELEHGQHHGRARCAQRQRRGHAPARQRRDQHRRQRLGRH